MNSSVGQSPFVSGSVSSVGLPVLGLLVLGLLVLGLPVLGLRVLGLPVLGLSLRSVTALGLALVRLLLFWLSACLCFPSPFIFEY